MRVLHSFRKPINVLRVEHDDGAVDTYAVLHGGRVAVCKSEPDVTALVREAERQRDEEMFITGWPTIHGTVQVPPSFVFLKVGSMGLSSSSEDWYLLGPGVASWVGTAGGYGGHADGWCPERLDLLLAVDRGMRRAAISQSNNVLGILDIETQGVVSMNVPARPAHKLALANDRALIAICGPRGNVQVLSTETAAVVFHRDIGQRATRPRFDEQEETLVIDTANGAMQFSLREGT